MGNLSLIDVNKPEVLKKTLNELMDFKGSAESAPQVTAESIGLGNVDNTKDVNKPVSTPQKKYIDDENAKDVKLKSDDVQEIDSDIELTEGKSLFAKRGNGEKEPLIRLANESGQEDVEVGSKNIPLKVFHSKKDINGNVVSKRPKVSIQDENGSVEEDNFALYSDVKKLEDEKANSNIFENAEVPNGVVTNVSCNGFNDVETDAMSVHIVISNLKTGNSISEVVLPLKLASNLSRGLMSKEDVAKLNDLVTRVAAMEGKASRYIYTDSKKPSAEEIDAFVQKQGHKAPYSGVAVVVLGTYHVWHYYENEDIGWRDDGSDTVQQATNKTLGIVKGENKNGKIYIENDGSMSLVGYDDLKSKTESNEQSMLTSIALSGGTKNGTLKVTFVKNGAESVVDNIEITGLGSAAFTESGAYATAEQGTKADKSIDETKANDLIDKAVSQIQSDLSAEIEQTKTELSNDIESNSTVLKESIMQDVDGKIADVNTEILGKTVRFDIVQALNEEQKAQARSNIGAGSGSFSGSYLDLSQQPIIDTTSDSSLETSGQETIVGTVKFHKISKTGALADAVSDTEHETISAAQKTQIETNKTGIATNKSAIESNDADISALQGRMNTAENNIEMTQSGIEQAETDIDTIEGKIPTQASASNQLADKNFVNSSINNVAAYAITKNADGDPFSTKAELTGATKFYSGGQVRVPTRNDYCTVLSDESQPKDSLGNYPTTRYSYQGGQWELSFKVNNTTFTSNQLSVLNSGITSSGVTQITTNKNDISTLKNGLGTLAKKSTITNDDISESAAIAQSKISGLVADLNAKATNEALNAVKTTADGAKTAAATAQSTANGKYSKPTTGIPKADLIAEVQSSLGKADTAIQSATGSNGVSVSKSGTALTITGTNATKSASGMMSAADKTKLDAFGNAADYALKTDIGSGDNWEVIYDKNSSDPAVNLGLTTGIFTNNQVVTQLPDLKPFKKLKITFWANEEYQVFYFDMNDVDLQTFGISTIDKTALNFLNVGLYFEDNASLGKRTFKSGILRKIYIVNNKYPTATDYTEHEAYYYGKIEGIR